MAVKDIRIELFDYPLPESHVAVHPLADRESCRLVVNSPGGAISHHIFSDIDRLIHPSTLVVANETRVINARMEFFKTTGSRIEIFLLEPVLPSDYAVSFATTGSCSWSCMVGNRKRWKGGPLEKKLTVAASETSGERNVTLRAWLGDALEGNAWEVRFEWEGDEVSFAEVVQAAGNIPIPPYLNRESEECDSDDYQTVYSRVEGSVAAPTAGLHFTDSLISRLKERGVEMEKVTLHVGAGTFQPVKSDSIGEHPMHTEQIVVERRFITLLADAIEAGRPVLAVGTTSVRTLESLPYIGLQIMRGASAEALTVPQWMAYDENNADFDTVAALRAIVCRLKEEGSEVLQASTAIMIAPGFKWRVVDRLITNFHQPRSTLLLLVSSFLNPGMDADCSLLMWRQIYQEALREGYRFLSYGDACLLSHCGVELPSSKSMALRQLVLDHICGLPPRVADDCDDVYNMSRAIEALQTVREGEKAEVYIGDGAAPLRFFTALAASSPGKTVEIVASENLSRRPVDMLVDTLVDAGGRIRKTFDSQNRMHLQIEGCELEGGDLAIDPGVSSQFVSALLMSSLLWKKGMRLSLVRNQPVSAAYIDMTINMIRRYGGVPELTDDVLAVSNEPLLPPSGVIVEPDWSAAAFFYELALLTPGREIKIHRLSPPRISMQGDAFCSGVYDALGVGTRFRPDGSAVLKADAETSRRIAESGSILNLDLGSTPDLVPSLAVALTQRGIRFSFRNVAHLRHKESNRIEALMAEFRKLGVVLSWSDDALCWHGERCEEEMNPVIDSHSDHRIAMAFGILSAAGRPLSVKNPEVVGKSYPDFWTQLINCR